MPSSDDQHRLNSRQRRAIDHIGEKFHFNLAPPPSSLDEITTGPKFVSLTDFIEQCDWEYSDLDVVEKGAASGLQGFRYLARPVQHTDHVNGVLALQIEQEVIQSP
jgi:hypothetical protein